MMDAKFRVFNLPEPVRDAIKSGREEADQRVQDFVGAAVREQLPMIARSLLALGVEHHPQTRPMRMKLDEEVLKMLRYAAAQTDVAASSLLVACLSMNAGLTEAVETPKPKGKPRKASSSASSGRMKPKTASKKPTQRKPKKKATPKRGSK